MSKLTWRQRKIWLPRAKPVIDSLFAGTFLIHEVQHHFNENRALIRQNYLRELIVDVCDYSPPGSTTERCLPFSCGLENGQPIIRIYLPELEKEFLALKGIPELASGAESLIRSLVLVGFMHEADHLSLGLVGWASPPTTEEIVEREMRVHARTCENTVRPLMEARQKVTFGAWEYYQAWVSGGRVLSSSDWKNFVTSKYKQ